MTEALVEVTAGVIVQNDTVLVCQRASAGHHPGKWEFPGGKVEPGERLEACLRRELEEELAIQAVVGRALWRTEHEYPGRSRFALTFFAVTSYAGTPTNCCFAAMRWVPIRDLAAIDFLEGDREFVTLLVDGHIRLSPWQ
jgi:8-oxo-dGTP diphosphatase